MQKGSEGKGKGVTYKKLNFTPTNFISSEDIASKVKKKTSLNQAWKKDTSILVSIIMMIIT